MGNSYPDRTNATGVWKVNEISKNKVTDNTWPGLTGHRGVWGSGMTPGTTNVIDFVNIQTAGNATDFGDLTVARQRMNSSAASRTRGIFFGGNSAPTRLNVIDYITIATTGNATDFGNISSVSQHGCGANNNTRALHCLGDISDQSVNTVEFCTIATTGNLTDFGDRTVHTYPPGAMSSTTRMVVGGGYSTPAGVLNVIDFVEMVTTGNFVDFGDLVEGRSACSGTGSRTRGIFYGGNDPNNEIDYVTIASHGNATDFGNLTSNAEDTSGGCSNTVRAVMALGALAPSSSKTNTLEQITIASTGNSTDFGDRTVSVTYAGSHSNGNGGLF